LWEEEITQSVVPLRPEGQVKLAVGDLVINNIHAAQCSLAGQGHLAEVSGTPTPDGTQMCDMSCVSPVHVSMTKLVKEKGY
jgi:hypothetical protein